MKRTIIIFAGLLLAATALPARAQQSPLVLSQARCREMALARSETLQQADNALRQAELDRRIAGTQYLPAFEASATGSYLFPDMDIMGMDLLMHGTYMAGISLTQPVYVGGKISTGRKLARIGEEAAAQRLRMTRMDVLAEADNAYWTYIAVARKVRLLESYSTLLDTLYRQVATAVRAGMALENDLLRIDTRRSDIRYQLQKVRNGADLCRMSLCRIIGEESGRLIEPADTVIRIRVPESLSTDLSARPELHLLEQGVEAGRAQVRLAQADLLPTVALTAGYTYYGNIKLRSMVDPGTGTPIPYTQQFRDGLGAALLAVKIPIFHWGETRMRVKKSRQDLQNAELEWQKNARLLDLEVQQAVRNLNDGVLLVQTAETGLRQADENLRVMRNRHAASMSPLTDLLDAQSQWQQASSNLIEAQTQFKLYETAYLRATGRLEQ